MESEANPGMDGDAAAIANRDIRAGIIMMAFAVAIMALTIALRPGGAIIFGIGLLIAGGVALVRGLRARP